MWRAVNASSSYSQELALLGAMSRLLFRRCHTRTANANVVLSALRSGNESASFMVLGSYCCLSSAFDTSEDDSYTTRTSCGSTKHLRIRTGRFSFSRVVGVRVVFPATDIHSTCIPRDVNIPCFNLGWSRRLRHRRYRDPRHIVSWLVLSYLVSSPPWQLVEKVALPLVAERLSTAYDAMSRRQTACLASAVSEILVYDPAEESLKNLLGAAREALQVRW